jgi:tetratricopeptide (TPR) repeat protein
LKLTLQEEQRLSEHTIDNVKAYDCYLRAEHQILRYDEKSLDSAFVYLKTGLDIMGDNAQLYAGMAYACWQYFNMGIGQEDYFKKAEMYVHKALDMKPDLSSALAMKGMLCFYEEYPRNLQDVISYMQRALQTNPFELRALTALAISYAMVGKPSEAITYVDIMEQHDPLNPWKHSIRGSCYLYDCQLSSVLEQSRKYYRADSTSPMAQNMYSWALAANGNYNEALAVISRTGAVTARNVMTVSCLLLKYAILNDRENAFRVMTPEFQKTCRRDFEWSYMIAARLALLGAKKEALDWLENAINLGFINYPYFECDQFLNSVREDGRFKRLMEKAESIISLCHPRGKGELNHRSLKEFATKEQLPLNNNLA